MNKMDFGTTIIGLILAILFVVPFMFVAANRKKHKSKIIKELNEFALNSNQEISQFDVWHENAIGIDKTGSTVFVIKKHDEHLSTHQINLLEIQKCRLVNNSRTVKNNISTINIAERIMLEFTAKNKSVPNQTIEFYNVEYNGTNLTGELQLAEKWCDLINSKLV